MQREFNDEFTTLYNTLFTYDSYFRDIINDPKNKVLFDKVQSSYLTGPEKDPDDLDIKAVIDHFRVMREKSVHDKSKMDVDPAFQKYSKFGVPTALDRGRQQGEYTDADMRNIAFLYDKMREMHKFFVDKPFIMQEQANGSIM